MNNTPNRALSKDANTHYHNRRTFLLLAGATALTTPSMLHAASLKRRVVPNAMGHPATGKDTWFTWSQVQPGAFVAIGLGGNSLAINTGAEPILIDAKNAPYGPTLAREAAAHAGGEIKLLISTHHHADHTGGNFAFPDARHIIHRNALPRIDAQVERYQTQIRAAIDGTINRPDDVEDAVFEKVSKDIAALEATVDALKVENFRPRSATPDFLFGTNALPLGDVEMKLHHFGAGHTDNDIVLEILTLNLIHTGDLVFNGLHPFFDAPAGANSVEWIKSLESIAALCDDETVVVPGHGEVSDISCVKAQITYIENLRETVQEAIDAGKSKKETEQLRPDFFDGLGFAKIAPRALGAVYDELAPNSPLKKSSQ